MSQNTIRRKPRKNKKYRFQLLSELLIQNYIPSKVLDVGGGKGLLTYLLNQSGWQAIVVDPENNFRPLKYRDLNTRKQVKLSNVEQKEIPRIISTFKEEMVQNFDLVVGLHAHGSNIQIINACEKYKKDFLLLPCCVIDEPIIKTSNVDWLESLVEYAVSKGFNVKQHKLDFKGQNIMIYSDKGLKRL